MQTQTIEKSQYTKLLTPKYIAIEAFGILSFLTALALQLS